MLKIINDLQIKHQNAGKASENETYALKNLLQEKTKEIESLQIRNQSEHSFIKQSFAVELEKANEKVN